MCKTRQKTDDSWRTRNATELASKLYYTFLFQRTCFSSVSTLLYCYAGSQWMSMACFSGSNIARCFIYSILGDLSHCTVASSSARVISCSMPTTANNRTAKTRIPFRKPNDWMKLNGPVRRIKPAQSHLSILHPGSRFIYFFLVPAGNGINKL